MTAVHTSAKNTVLIAATLLLTHCASEAPSPDTSVTGAQMGILQTDYLLAGGPGKRTPPAGLLGVYVAHFLVGTSGNPVRGAMFGVDTGVDTLVGSQESLGASFELLQQLGIVLQQNIPDMLNRSTDRQKTLDAYTTSLSQIYERSKTHLTALKQQQQGLLAVRRDKRSRVVTVQHDLNLALQKKDYTTASVKQSEIVAAKSEQAKADAEVNQLQSTITLYTNLHKIAERRLTAISANRAALIAGVTVVDVPGIQELGIYEKKNGKTTNSTNIFGN